MQNYINNRNELFNKLNNKCKYYHYILKQKSKEIFEKNNQLFMFYILLFISILIIIYQKITIQNMSNLIYILKMALKDSQIENKK